MLLLRKPKAEPEHVEQAIRPLRHRALRVITVRLPGGITCLAQMASKRALLTFLRLLTFLSLGDLGLLGQRLFLLGGANGDQGLSLATGRAKGGLVWHLSRALH